jgi:hypothetical protein
VVLIQADGTGRTVVIHWPFEGYMTDPYVVFSPDGAWLMFDGWPGAGGSPIELYTIALDGSGLAQVTTDGAMSPSWSR